MFTTLLLYSTLAAGAGNLPANNVQAQPSCCSTVQVCCDCCGGNCAACCGGNCAACCGSGGCCSGSTGGCCK